MSCIHWLNSRSLRCKLAALLCVTLLGGSVVRADATADFNLAANLYKQKRWAQAAKQFEKFVKENPKHEKIPSASFFLGLAYVNQEDYKAARDTLRTFVKTYPDNTNLPQARYRVAECSYLLDDFPAALPELTEFIEKHPQDPLVERALPYLGDVQLKQNQAAAALTSFDKALKEFPNGALVDDAKFGRARALEALNKPAEAIEQYRELAANKENPRAAEALFQIAARQFDGKQFAEAANSYRELLVNFPKSSLGPSARMNAGYALYQAGKFAEAAEWFATAQKDPASSVAAGYWRGLSLKSQGDVKQAATVLAAVAKEASDAPLAESINFQRGLCARQLGDPAEALKLFTSVADTFPKGEFADDSLHAAAELAVDAGDLANANKLLARLVQDYPGSGLRLHYELLMGRVDLAEAVAAAKAAKPPNEIAAEHRQAGDRFDKVLKESTVARTQLLARYYLGVTRQLQGQHDEAVKVLAPLIEVVQQEGAKSEFGDALLVLAESQLAIKQYDVAQASAEKYLSLFPQGRQTPRALYVVAIAAGQRNEGAASKGALDRLTKDFRTHPLTPSALLQLAEFAEAKQDWPVATERYTALIPIAEGTDNQAFAFRGLAWSLFKQDMFAPAAEQFGKVLQKFPQHKLVSECAYYRAEALKEAGQKDQAVAGFTDVIKQFGPQTPAAAGAEKDAPLLYAFRAGLQKARTLRELKQIPEADQSYQSLLEKFPQPAQLDRLLDEWALMNYEAQNYLKADEIFNRLIKDVPTSELADNAKLSLAESDLVNDKLESAQKTFLELLASDKSDPDVKERSLYQLIVLAVDQRRWGEVGTLADRLAKEFPNSQHVPYARYSQAEGVINAPKATDAELQSAKQQLEAVRSTAPEKFARDSFHGRAWVLLAELAYREKSYPDVLKIADELKEKHKDSSFIYQIEEIVGRSYKQQAEFAKAREAFDRVLADPEAFRTPTAAKSQFLIAETFFLEMNWDEAFLGYQKVYTSYDLPEWQSAALLQSGKCDEQMKQWKEAVMTYAELIEKFPKSEHVDEAKQRLDAVKKKAGGA